MVPRSKLVIGSALVAIACGGRSVTTESGDAPAAGGEASALGGTTASGGTQALGGTTSGGSGGEGGLIVRTCGPSIRPGGIRCEDGLICDLICGLADSGTRECACHGGQFECTPCDFTNSPFRIPPPEFYACPPGVGDEVPCSEDGTVCGPVEGGDYCACWLSPSDGQSWDCDDPPTSWGL
jgi:hypothetical protein